MNEWVSDGMNAVKPKQKVMITSVYVGKKHKPQQITLQTYHRKKYAHSRP